MNINLDLLAYFDGETTDKPLLFELNKKAGLLRNISSILEIRSTSCGRDDSCRRKILELYDDLAFLFRIPFPLYFIKKLKNIEEEESHYHWYRDHIMHLFYVFCLGCYIFDNSVIYRTVGTTDYNDFLLNWIVASFLHDIGYAFLLGNLEERFKTTNTFQDMFRCDTSNIEETFAEIWFYMLTMCDKSMLYQWSRDRKLILTANNFIKISHSFPALWHEPYKRCNFRFHKNRKDLFNDLPNNLDFEHLTGFNFSLTTFYKNIKADNHGLVSSLILLYILESRKLICSSNEIQNQFQTVVVNANPYCVFDRFKKGIWAISLHALKSQYLFNRNLIFVNTPPHVSLLLIADGLQCWDRRYFALDPTTARVPIPSSVIGLSSDFNSLFWKFEDVNNSPGFDKASYSNIIRECSGLLQQTDVENIIHEGVAT